MRADKFLVDKGYYVSRTAAQSAIKAAKVRVNGKLLKKASTPLSEIDVITATQLHPWVSRGGIKLAYALENFGLNPEGMICLDIGASTGGFSDVLLQKGAAKVYAVDVGHGQLHQRLIGHERLVSMEGQDAREISADMFSALPRLIVCDASFISAMKVLSVAVDIVPSGSRIITLVKPQFEVGKDGIARGGIVKSKALADQALSDVCAWISVKGWQVLGTTDSPIKGGSGNSEFLLYGRKN